MPRIRTLKPEFFTSPSTAAVDFPVRIFFQAMWCWADDFGIGETNLNGLLGFAFPDDDGFSAQDLRRFCADVAQHFGVVFYSVRGRHYYYVPSWENHQKLEKRSGRRKHPTPDDPDATPDLRFQACADSAPESRRGSGADLRKNGAGTGEQGNRGTGEQGNSSSAMPPREDVESLCTHLRDRIVGNGGKAAIGSKWRTDGRLLLDRDGVDLAQAHRLIDWCQDDSFWHTNILSMTKFREQYQALLMKAKASQRGGRDSSGLTPREMEIARAEQLKMNPDPEILRRAGLSNAPTLRAINGGSL